MDDRDKFLWSCVGGGVFVYGLLFAWLYGKKRRTAAYWLKRGWAQGRNGGDWQRPLQACVYAKTADLPPGRAFEWCGSLLATGYDAGARGLPWKRALPKGRGFGESDLHTRSVALMKQLAQITNKLQVGEHVYVVGGAVRDFLLGKNIKDVDIVVDSVALGGRDAAWLAQRIAEAIPVRTTVQTNQYGVAIMTVADDWIVNGTNLKGEVIELATARKEWYGEESGKGYKPHAVAPSTIEEDVRRREFTMNTLLWRLAQLTEGPEKAEVVDITGCGVRDLKRGELYCPSDPDIVFRDDPTRMVRAAKFMVRHGFTVPPVVAESIRRNAERLRDVPPNAVAKLLLDVLLKDSATAPRALHVMRDLGIVTSPLLSRHFVTY